MSKYIVKARKSSLKAPLTTDATSVILRSLKDSKGNNVALASIGEWAVIVIKQGTNLEMIKVDAISYDADGTATLSVATDGRHLDPTTPYAGSGVGLAFQSGAEVILTNDPLTVTQFGSKNLENIWKEVQTFEEIPELPDANPTTNNQAVRKLYVDELDDTNVHKTGDETIQGVKTFESSPVVPTPTTDFQASTKKYVDDTTTAGAPDADTNTKGIVQKATDEQFAKGESTGSTGASLFITPDMINKALSYKCHENIAQGDAVSMVVYEGAFTSELVNLTGDANERTAYNTTWRAQSFTTSANAKSIKSITIRGRSTVPSGANPINFFIRETLTGENVGTGVGTIGQTTADITVEMNVIVSPSTTYYLIVNDTNTSASYDFLVLGENGASYGTTHFSTNSGASWSAESPSWAWKIKIDEGIAEKNSIVKSSGAGFDARLNFIGFALETKSAGENCLVNEFELPVLSGLTAGVEYYLSETQGQLVNLVGDNNLIDYKAGGTNKDFDDLKWKAQSFTTSAGVNRIKTIRVRLRNTNGTSNTVRLSIRSSLTGSNLWSTTVSPPATYADRTVFPNLKVNPNTTYYLIISNVSHTADGDVDVDTGATYGTVHASTNAGVSWTNDGSYRWHFSIVELRDPNIERWVGQSLSTTLLNRKFRQRPYVSKIIDISSTKFICPLNGMFMTRVNSTSNGSFTVDGVSFSISGMATVPVLAGDTLVGSSVSRFRITQ